ncbi:endonuclease/exonuclease/phosphatase (EEP) superfamily protein YafD [Sphingomonas kyeonggiensis]|uniref:Endonuclease/exonuclease/phosphatase (EEP) superfamily protein YafD n=1 Tax=Sphingomonas kyeonggiensis TaxID=1268553 RepID=A0A7W7K587_9SPHN|nr:endonuclease/exonuclease/phosphatase family protein [Sphingomonas kyeonggiensis]MBB4840660.1 endonuclease/exonuclease/phosphatase (EEP) superfamily protein YafD [Sphingomonas kyeonggiensis]
MRLVRILGALLIAGGSLAAWVSYAGAFMPMLDAFASFMPLFGLMILIGLALGRRLGLWAIAAALLGLAPVALRVVPELTRDVPRARSGMQQVRVLSHNVWVKNSDPAETAQTILDARPDVVMLQELDGNFRPMLAALRQKLPYGTDCPKGCGMAILSRWPIDDSGYLLRDEAGRKFGPPLTWARIIGPDQRPFTVITLHYPHPTMRDQAVRIRDMAQALARIDREGLIVAGDMNLTPWAAAMHAQDQGFAPLTRMTRALPSWPRVLPVLPIDQLYAGPDWGLVSAEKLRATGSDHRPVLVTLGRR